MEEGGGEPPHPLKLNVAAVPSRSRKIRATSAGVATHSSITPWMTEVRSVEMPVAASTLMAPQFSAPMRIEPNTMPTGRLRPRSATVIPVNPMAAW